MESKPTLRFDTLVAGGGIGGLTAALALQQKGFSVAVYEAVQKLGEVGAGVTITARSGVSGSSAGLA